MDLIFSFPVVVAVAIVGAIASTSASALQSRGVIGPAGAKNLNRAGYACTGASILLFIIAGFRA